MCGIAGIVGPSLTPRDQARVRSMTDRLAHRGPDDCGLLFGPLACLGHRRLSIIDLTAAGHQPMTDGDNALVFNGEIYNFRDLRQELEQAGVAFSSNSDTEVLLRGYRVWGNQILGRLRGMFAFALWDGDRGRLLCARDPFGKKPFYYHWTGSEFTFASEMPAVIGALESRPDIDEHGLGHYLLKGYSAPGRSICRSVQTVQAGHCLEVDVLGRTLREWRYWQQRFRLPAHGNRSPAEVSEKVHQLLGRAVERRFVSDVPVGILLSGGVDSSLITFLARERIQQELLTFTATFPGTSFDESIFAAQVANRVGSRHEEIRVDMAGIPDVLPRLVEAYGEPFGDTSAIPTLALFEGLKPYAKVVITGDGGDEVFAGYRDVLVFQMRARLLPWFAWAHGIIGGLGPLLCDNRSRRARELGYLITCLAPDGAQLFSSLYREGWTRRWRRRFFRPEAVARIDGSDVEDHEGRRFTGGGENDLQRYLNAILERLTQAFLVKIDRASMAHSVEARSPLLDQELFSWACGLSRADLLQSGEPKSILKGLLARYTGAGFARRRKSGFSPPLGPWLRQPAAATWVHGQLTVKDTLVHELISPQGVENLLNVHRQGFDCTGQIWRLLFLSEWHGRFVRGGSGERTREASR